MEERMINFETVGLAKEKGFGYFHSIELTDPFNLCTQSLLQAWLRDEHNIDVISYPSAHIKNKYIVLIISKLELIYDESEIKYGSYEEALEIGLQQALKQLK